MKHFNAIAAAAVIGTSFLAATPANAEVSICKYEGVPQARCKIQHLRVRSGWKDEVLIDPDGTTRRISRETRGKVVQINLYLPGQSKGSFHQGTYRLSGSKAKIITEDGGSYLSHGNKVIIYVDGGTFSYTLWTMKLFKISALCISSCTLGLTLKVGQ